MLKSKQLSWRRVAASCALESCDGKMSLHTYVWLQVQGRAYACMLLLHIASANTAMPKLSVRCCWRCSVQQRCSTLKAAAVLLFCSKCVKWLCGMGGWHFICRQVTLTTASRAPGSADPHVDYTVTLVHMCFHNAPCLERGMQHCTCSTTRFVKSVLCHGCSRPLAG